MASVGGAASLHRGAIVERAGAQDGCPGRIAVQGLRGFRGAGPGAACAGDPLSPGALGDAWGQTIVAALPRGITGHFGPELRRFVLLQHYQGQVTVERLTAQLRAIGLSISKRQVMRLLIERPGWLSCREQRCAACWPADGELDYSR